MNKKAQSGGSSNTSNNNPNSNTSRWQKIGTKIANIGKNIKEKWKSRKENKKSSVFNATRYTENVQKELDRLEKKSFLGRAFARFFPENIFGVMIVYFLLQDFVIDFLFGFNYGSQQLITTHVMACFVFGLYLLFAHFIPSYDPDDGNASMFSHITRSILNISLIFGVGLLIEFTIIPIIQNLVSGSFISRMGLTAFESQNLVVLFTRVLKPYWGFFACLFFGRYTRVGKTYLTIIFLLVLVLNVSLIESQVRSTVGIFSNSKYVGSGREQAKMVIEIIKINGGKILHTLNPVTWLQNYLNQLRGEFGDEHIDGEYANNAGVSGVIFRNPYSSNPLSVFENNNPKSDANVIVEYVRNPENDCIINGICDSDNKLTIQCCVDNIKFLAKNSPAESPSNSGLCSEYKSYSVSDLAYSQSLHSCYIEATDTGKSLLDTEERVRVNITGNYTFQTVGNKDFRFAEKSLIVRCRTNQQYSISSLNCLGFAGDIISSESSSGPITIGIGTPKDFNEEVLTIDNQLNESEQQILPLLISVSNKGDGVIKSINNLYLAIPKDMDLSKYHYCNFEKVNNKNPNCYSAFGSGISSNPLNPNGLNDKYDCYEYSFEQEYTQQKVLSQIQTGSIYCSITPKKEILDGNKATKNIKVFFNYTYEISKNIDITFKNTGSKSNPTETITSSPSPQTPCEDGTQIGECSTNQAGFKCLVNEDGVSQLVPSCPVCSCVNGKVCHPSSKVCIDEKYENIVENVCTCTDEGVVEEECPEGYTAFCRKLVYSPGYQCLCEESQAT